LCPSLYLDLNLDLDLDLNPSMYRELLAKSHRSLFQQLFASLLGSMFDLMYGELQALSRLASYRQTLPPRRPVGRGMGGRIVVLRPADTIGCGTDIDPCIIVRVIRILITRILSLLLVSSVLCTHCS